jgi:pyruvate/2-oxoglutarate dehydrogenase complex dihydrolipoamide acyltransferase (E2) component
VTEVLFPPLSKETPGSVGVVSSWFVADGATVAEGQVLAEVQVDKVSADVPAPMAGRIHLLVPEEAEVTQGSVIARVV